MNSRSDPDIGPNEQCSPWHRHAVKWFLCGLACALLLDAWVIRLALSGSFQATIDLPSGHSVTVSTDRERRSENPKGRILIEFAPGESSNRATHNATRLVAEWR
jgi:hypothetical protein